MRDVTNNNFGLLIAYVLPGLTALWGAAHFSPTLRIWLAAGPSELPTIGGFLYVTLGSVAAGMTVSTVRWLFVDGLHHLTGLREPRWNFGRLGANVGAFDVLIRIHYQFYQFNANMLVAVVFAYTARRVSAGMAHTAIGWEDVTWFLFVVVFFTGSRDTLRKYYLRVEQVLRGVEQQNGEGREDVGGSRHQAAHGNSERGRKAVDVDE